MVGGRSAVGNTLRLKPASYAELDNDLKIKKTSKIENDIAYYEEYCQAQHSWLALISVYYRPTANHPEQFENGKFRVRIG